jgi:hypothetical protein
MICHPLIPAAVVVVLGLPDPSTDYSPIHQRCSEKARKLEKAERSVGKTGAFPSAQQALAMVMEDVQQPVTVTHRMLVAEVFDLVPRVVGPLPAAVCQEVWTLLLSSDWMARVHQRATTSGCRSSWMVFGHRRATAKTAAERR